MGNLEIVLFRLKQPTALFRNPDGSWWMSEFTKDQHEKSMKECIRLIEQEIEKQKQ